MRKVPKFVVIVGLVLVVVLASAMVRALALSGGCATPTITWVGNANSGPDSWHTASNWKDNLNINRVPGAGDHVCISSAANTDSIVYSTGSTSVASLESEEPLTISGGALQLTSPTEESKANNLTLSGSGNLSGAGNLTIPAGGTATWSGGTMTGSGKTLISAASGSQPAAATLSITGTSFEKRLDGRALQNAGTITYDGIALNSGNGALIDNSGTFDITGNGNISSTLGGTKTHFENRGTLKKTSGTGSSDIGATVANTGGTVDVISGTLNLGGGLDNFTSSTGALGKVTGGTYMIRSNSVLKFLNADIDVNAATIVLEGLGSAILDQHGSDAIDNLSVNDGSFTIRADRDLRTVGALRNDDSVSIGKDSVLTTTGEYVQADGSTSTALEDTTSKLAASGARVRVQNGVMKGLGTVEPALEATGGSVAPGLSSGILKVAGSYVPGSNGTLDVEIGGTAPGSGHDQLDVGTTASLAGTLDIDTPSGFTPTGGESFTILKCGAVDCRSGQFDNVQGTNVGPGKEYQVRYNATDVTLHLNTPPEAADDTAQTAEDTPLNDIDVLSNDEDVDGDTLSVSSVTEPSHGTAQVAPDGNVNYTPNADYNGPDSFSYTVSDGNGGTDTATVSITVTAVNDAPSFTKGDNQAVNEDAAAQTVDPWATEISGGPADENGQQLTFEVTNDNSDLFSAQPQVAPGGTLTYTPAADAFGSATVTVKLHDDGGTANGGQDESDEQTFQITVNSVNDKPSINSQGNDQVNEDSGPRTVSGWVTNFNPGPANESGQNVDDYIVTDANGDPVNSNLFSVQPDVSNDGTLSYTPAPDAFGSITLKVKVRDDSGTANGGVDTSDAQDLTITINSVNDAPSFTKGDDQTVDEDAPAQTVANWATEISGGPADENGQQLTFEVTNDNNDLFSAQPQVAPGGTLTYTPAADAFGSATVTVKLHDDGGTENSGVHTSDPQTFQITVNAVNDAPEVAFQPQVTTNEDTNKVITLSASDVDGDNLTFAIVSGPTNGTLGSIGPVNCTGTAPKACSADVTYTPNNNYNGPDPFTFKANDGTADSFPAPVFIQVDPVNDTPVAQANTYSTDEDTTLNVAAPGVLGNDSDADGDSLTATKIDGPAHGTLTLNNNGSFEYKPEGNYHGPDAFTYKATDGQADSDVVTASITVNSVNDKPTADAQSVTTDEDIPKDVTLTGNDVDGDSLTYDIVDGPAHGQLSGTGATRTYTPDPNYHGPDSFTYKVNDGTVESETAEISITVTSVNDAPVADDQSVTTDEDTAKDLILSASDVDENDNLTYEIVEGPQNGTLSGTGANRTYTPDPDYFGDDSLTYKANDGSLDSNEATVSITVNAVNDAPVAKDDTAMTDEDTSALIDILSNDEDVDDGDTLSVSSFTQPSHGQVSLDSGKLRYEPTLNYNGPDSFTYKAKDASNAESNEAKVNITVKAVNDAPTCQSVSIETGEDTHGSVAADCSDVDADTITYEIVDQATDGTASADGGNLKYDPNANFNGSDSFTYRASDGIANSEAATVDVKVNAVNDAPVAKEESYSTDEDNTLNINAPGVLSNDTDVDNTAAELKALQVSGPTHGTLTLNNSGSFAYKPNADFFGDDSFTYKANDGTDDSNTVTVSITVNSVNDAPVAKEESYSTDEDNTLSVDAPGVLENDTDVDNANFTAVQISGPAHGTLTLNDNGSFEYKPEANYNGPDSFTYKANDGTEDSNLATVSITVSAVNDAPVADDQSVTTDEDTPKEIALSATDVDEGDNLTYDVVSGPAHGTLSGTGANVTYTPDADFFGEDSFTFSASDGNLDSNVATVSITVNAVNDAPVPEDNSYTTPEDTPLIVGSPGLLGNDTDVEQDTLRVADGNADTADGISPVSGPANGTLELHEDGSFTYTPTTNYHGTDSFDYRVCDNGSPEPQCSVQTATVNVTIDPVNDDPEAANDANSTDEDTTLNVAAPGVLGNDSDVEDDPLTAVKVTEPAHGTLTLDADGSYTYTPNTNFNGTDSFKYKANDGTTDSNEATVTITVNAVNDAPVAADDTKTTNEDTPLTFPSSDLVSNDDEGAPDEVAQDLTVTQVFDGTHGTVSLGTDGNITFTPETNFSGDATFTYRVCDNGSPSECSEQTATVNVTVNAVNDAPDAVDDTATTDEDTAKDIAVITNDTDVDNTNAQLSVSSFSQPSHGQVTQNADGTLKYTPAEDYNGPDSFTYNASDGTDDSKVATVSITVTAVNDAPVALDDTDTTPEDTQVEILASILLRNDSTGPANESDQTLRISAVSGATDGSTAEINEAGNVLFTPALNFNGLASFNYTVCDNGTPEKCYEATATVLVTVSAVNDPPVADDQLVTTNEDTAKLITLSATDVDNGSLTYKVTSLPTHGKLYKGDSQLATDEITSASSSNPVTLSGNQLTYKPDPNYNNTGGATADTFKFLANDGTLDSNEATVSITVAAENDVPIAVDDSYSTNEGSPLTVNAPGVLGNDSDVDSANLTAEKVTGPANGQLTLNTNGSFTYTPSPGFSGRDTFTYKANDGSVDSNTVIVTITVNPVGTSAPMVTSVSPLDQATGVSRSTNVTATFNVAMNARTLKSTTFILTVPGKRGPTQVSASVSCNNPCTTATLTPSKTLAANTTYTATVKGTVEDASGRKLGSDYVWRFTTGG